MFEKVIPEGYIAPSPGSEILAPSTGMDITDRSWVLQPAMADTLTNSGTVGVAPPMSLPSLVDPESGSTPSISGSVPPVMQGIAEYDEFEDEPETDGFFFNDNNIFENSGFLGIAIGRKAKARQTNKKAARVEKRQVKKQYRNQALTDAKTALVSARNISTQAQPVLSAQALPLESNILPSNQLLPDSTNYMPAMPTDNPYNILQESEDPIYDQDLNPQLFSSPQAYQQAISESARKKESKTLIYAGIAAAALIIMVLILKK